jgi:hypothetical protein
MDFWEDSMEEFDENLREIDGDLRLEDNSRPEGNLKLEVNLRPNDESVKLQSIPSSPKA